jgi:hypothetical protein
MDPCDKVPLKNYQGFYPLTLQVNKVYSSWLAGKIAKL